MKLNRPLSAVEGQRISGALTAIDSGSPALLDKTNPHPYKNLPDPATGALLPPSVDGYKTYYVGPAGRESTACYRQWIEQNLLYQQSLQEFPPGNSSTLPFQTLTS